jgi:hypothetical protein
MVTASTLPAPTASSAVIPSPVLTTPPPSPVSAVSTGSPPCTAQCRAVQALKESSHPALRRLRIQETENAIIISGRVSTYYLKQLAQETIMSIRRDLALVNQVTVATE